MGVLVDVKLSSWPMTLDPHRRGSDGACSAPSPTSFELDPPVLSRGAVGSNLDYETLQVRASCDRGA